MVLTIILSLTFIVILALILLYIFPIIQIVGDSMFPTYKNGETYITIRLFNADNLKKGDVVLCKAPYEENKHIIKRITEIQYVGNKAVRVFLVGDNKNHSYDSRNYGYVPVQFIVSKLLNQKNREV